MKICSSCKESKSLDSFSKSKREKDAHHYYCKACCNAAAVQHYIKHKRRVINRNITWRKANLVSYKRQQKDARLRKNYGISIETFESMCRAQNYECAICSRKKMLCVDHNHTTGKVRSLLCSDCNVSLGRMAEDKNRFLNAISYLERHA